MQGLLRGKPLAGNADEPQQQQRCDRHGGDQHHRAKEPPGLQVVVDHAGEALQVVIAKEAVPERLALHQQFKDVPGKTHHSRERQAGERAQTLPGCCQIPAPCTEQQQGQTGDDHRNGTFGQNRQAEHQPRRPPALGLGCSETTPLQQQADGQQATQQRITDGGATPNQHQWREPESKGGADGGSARPRTGLLWPTQQGVGQAQHHGEAGQRRGEA